MRTKALEIAIAMIIIGSIILITSIIPLSLRMNTEENYNTEIKLEQEMLNQTIYYDEKFETYLNNFENWKNDKNQTSEIFDINNQNDNKIILYNWFLILLIGIVGVIVLLNIYDR